MAIDTWLPIGFELPDGAQTRVALFGGTDWQVLEALGGGRILVAHDTLIQRWQDAGLIDDKTFGAFRFGDRQLGAISCDPRQTLCPVTEAKTPADKSEALAFAEALKATRDIDTISALQDALYVEKIGRLLPTYGLSYRAGDDIVLGCWLTGGAGISATSFHRLHQAMSWLDAADLQEVVQAAGIEGVEATPLDFEPYLAEKAKIAPAAEKTADTGRTIPELNSVFELAGRPELAAFFNEHVVDIILNCERYKALGIEFPSAVILHGPPGCGKTFAVEQLVDFLGWPSFQIDASSIASPYIHETSKKVAQVFNKAMASAPSVLVIDEMEAFLADRSIGLGSSHHRIEEVAEFLRRIPEAIKKGVLIIAMTNRIDLIDAAIQRRGRFDHVIKVDFPSEIEVRTLLDKLLSSLPKESDVDSTSLARELAGRPLSDVAFVVREGARLAARSGRERLDHASLLSALRATPARQPGDGNVERRIGFV